MSKSVSTFIEELQAWAPRSECRLVVLFGSQVRGGAGPARDIDLALDFGMLPPPERRLAIIDELQQLAHPTPVDVVFLHAGTSPVLRFEIFRGGEPIFEREPDLFLKETVRAIGQYEDAIPFRRARERLVLEGLTS